MVVKSKQGTPKLLVLEQCRSVVNQILLITDNEKKFPAKYQAITQRIIDTALEMYALCYDANSIFIYKGDKEAIKQRMDLQGQAIRCSKRLDSLLSLAYSDLHLKSKSVNYIWKLNGIARDTIKKWRDSEKKKLS